MYQRRNEIADGSQDAWQLKIEVYLRRRLRSYGQKRRNRSQSPRCGITRRRVADVQWLSEDLRWKFSQIGNKSKGAGGLDGPFVTHGRRTPAFQSSRLSYSILVLLACTSSRDRSTVSSKLSRLTQAHYRTQSPRESTSRPADYGRNPTRPPQGSRRAPLPNGIWRQQVTSLSESRLKPSNMFVGDHHRDVA